MCSAEMPIPVSVTENTPDPSDAMVGEVTTAFWDLWLKGDESAGQRLADAGAPPSLASLESDPG